MLFFVITCNCYLTCLEKERWDLKGLVAASRGVEHWKKCPDGLQLLTETMLLSHIYGL